MNDDLHEDIRQEQRAEYELREHGTKRDQRCHAWVEQQAADGDQTAIAIAFEKARSALR